MNRIALLAGALCLIALGYVIGLKHSEIDPPMGHAERAYWEDLRAEMAAAETGAENVCDKVFAIVQEHIEREQAADQLYRYPQD